MNALDTQVGGKHYKDRSIQPVELWALLGLSAFQGAIIKYVTRHREKNGEQDVHKAWHFVLLEYETGAEKPELPSNWFQLLKVYVRANKLTRNEAEFIKSYLKGKAAGRLKSHIDSICEEAGYAKTSS